MSLAWWFGGGRRRGISGQTEAPQPDPVSLELKPSPRQFGGEHLIACVGMMFSLKGRYYST
jgi:hypothetical protein